MKDECWLFLSIEVLTILSGTLFTIQTTNCLPPGEQHLVRNEKDWNALQEIKARQFEKVKSLLKKQFEDISGCKIIKIYSLAGQDGVRFESFTLSENLASRFS